MHRRTDHVQNQHAKWHNSEGINGSVQYTYSITDEFLFESCNCLLKGLSTSSCSYIHLPTESSQLQLKSQQDPIQTYSLSPHLLWEMNFTCSIQGTTPSDRDFLMSTVHCLALQDTSNTEYFTLIKYALYWSLQCLQLGFIPQFPYTTLHESPPPTFQVKLVIY